MFVTLLCVRIVTSYIDLELGNVFNKMDFSLAVMHQGSKTESVVPICKRDYSFSTYAKFSEKPTFLTP